MKSWKNLIRFRGSYRQEKLLFSWTILQKELMLVIEFFQVIIFSNGLVCVHFQNNKIFLILL